MISSTNIPTAGQLTSGFYGRRIVALTIISVVLVAVALATVLGVSLMCFVVRLRCYGIRGIIVMMLYAVVVFFL